MADEDIKALQEEEREVLESIYEGDDQFKALSATQFQYKYGQDGQGKAFILDLTWTDQYPNEMPQIDMDTFYNKHLLADVKESVLTAVKSEAEAMLGMSMTYSLFEHVKEHIEELLANQPDVIQVVTEAMSKVKTTDDDSEVSSKTEKKKEQFTKAQKRRMWDKGGLESEERPRGWNWFDVIRHLSQTGGSKDE
ncbi:RWD domain-containing protein 4-like isoform X2 [Tigriopus californicus]|uniref:RWD domain-containing protein 4-like isoform X2 n=1 Tax=Tigriopus californicus TaxID=6832 RepID=UPI0027DA5ACB|nr:RWD domain-containing protein 4-like isoform X2 [Tigriopus californicus]